MAKVTTETVTTYKFVDELSGEHVVQDEEPTTFKIKLSGDAQQYEKVMSKDNEDQFRNWLKQDGVSLVAEYIGQIQELERKIEALEATGIEPQQRASKPKEKPLDPIREAVGLSKRGTSVQFGDLVDSYLASLPEDQRPKNGLTNEPYGPETKFNVNVPQKPILKLLQDQLEDFTLFAKNQTS